MDSTYESGVFIAFLIGLVKVAISINHLFSQRARNLAKVGIYYRAIAGAYTSTTPFDPIRFCFYLGYMLVVTPIFSWLSVGASIWGLIAFHTRRSAVPEKVKEVQYKIASLDLTELEMKALQKQLIDDLQLPPSRFIDEVPRSELEQEFTMFGEAGLTVEFDRTLSEFRMRSHSPDYLFLFHSRYKYRFAGNRLEVRLLDDWIEEYGQPEWRVKDGVVLELECRERNTKIEFKIASVEEELRSYALSVLWHEWKGFELRFFAMSKCPDLFDRNEFRGAVRQELQNMRLGLVVLKKLAATHALDLVETNDGFEVQFPLSFPEADREKISALFSSEALGGLGVEYRLMTKFKKEEQLLLRLLEEELPVKA